MTSRPVIAALALSLAAGGAAPAVRSEGGWSITEANPSVAPAAPLALATDGRLLAASWACDAVACPTSLATRPSGGGVQLAERIPGRLEASTPSRSGGALLLTAPSSRPDLTAYDVTSAGRVARSQVVERGHVRGVVVASNRRGTAAVAWLRSIAPWRLRIRVRRHAGGVFQPVRTVARFRHAEDFGNAALAVGPRGEVAILWASDGALRIRVLRRGARRFGPALRAGSSDRVARISAAYTAGGTLAVIWSSADGGEEQNRTAIVRAAALPAGSARFTRAVRLGEGADRETFVFGGGTAVRSVAAGRTANIAWTSRSLRVRLATVHADGTVTATRSLDAPGVLVDAIGSTTGRALIAWTHDPFGSGSVARAVLRLAPERLGPREAVGPAGSRATAAVLDDEGTRALVTWAAGDPVLSTRWGLAERALP
jgi:hypothetical protein